MGGTASEYNGQTNIFFNTRYRARAGAAEKAEQWQILTPVRQNQTGVLALNRAIQGVARGCGWGNTICEVGAVESAGPIAKSIAN